jgi:hypothetical protein
MTRHHFLLTMTSLLLLVSACASAPEKPSALKAEPVPGLEIRGLLMFNATTSAISSVQLLVPATGGFISCGNIAPRAGCSTTFPEREYRGNAVDISWSKGGQSWSTGEFIVRPPKNIDLKQPAYVRVIIAGPGVAGAEIVQESASNPLEPWSD